MKIQNLHLPALRNEEHFQFMTDTDGLIDNAGTEALQLVEPYAQFEVLLEQEDVALETIRKSSYTTQITDMDRMRDLLYHGFDLFTRAYLCSANNAKKEAAQRIRIIVDSYGDIRLQGYKQESGSVTNFVTDINTRCGDDLDTLGGREWIDALAEANALFINLMDTRHDDHAAQPDIDLRATRKAIDQVYQTIRERIESSTVLLPDQPIYVQFATRLNERIDYYRNAIARRKGAKAETGGDATA